MSSPPPPPTAGKARGKHRGGVCDATARRPAPRSAKSYHGRDFRLIGMVTRSTEFWELLIGGILKTAIEPRYCPVASPKPLTTVVSSCRAAEL
jgi:hypothetical protein